MATEKSLVTIILNTDEPWSGGTVTIIDEGIEKRGVELPEPSSYNSTLSTMVDTGTSVSGKTLGSVVRDSVAQISLSWSYIEAPVWSMINQLFKGNDFSRRVQFYDQMTGEFVIREMSVSDRSGGMWRRDPITGDVMGWTGCSLKFTEV